MLFSDHSICGIGILEYIENATIKLSNKDFNVQKPLCFLYFTVRGIP